MLFLLQVRAHQLVLPPCDVVIRAVADYVRNLQNITDLDAVARDIFKHSQVSETAHLVQVWNPFFSFNQHF